MQAGWWACAGRACAGVIWSVHSVGVGSVLVVSVGVSCAGVR